MFITGRKIKFRNYI